VLWNGPIETGLHLSLSCPFAKAVWTQVLSWEHFDIQHIHSNSHWHMVGQGHKHGAQRGKKAFQWSGNLHILEYLEGKKQTNLQQHYGDSNIGCL